MQKRGITSAQPTKKHQFTIVDSLAESLRKIKVKLKNTNFIESSAIIDFPNLHTFLLPNSTSSILSVLLTD